MLTIFLLKNPLEQFSIFCVKSCFTSNFVNVFMTHFIIIMLCLYFLNWSVLLRNVFHLFFLKIFELIKIAYIKNVKMKIVIYFPIFFFTFFVILSITSRWLHRARCCVPVEERGRSTSQPQADPDTLCLHQL